MIFARPIENIFPVALSIAVIALAFIIAVRVMRDLFVSFFRDAVAWLKRRRATPKPWRPSARSLAVWAGHPARWWQFWRPQSGIIGGIIGAVILIAAYYLLNRLFGA